MKNLGFTLAEVLITLGIIGVVSAIAIPTFTSNIQNQANASKLSSTVSDLENAFGIMMTNEEEENILLTQFGKNIKNQKYTNAASNLSNYLKLSNSSTTITDFGYSSTKPFKTISGTALDRSFDFGTMTKSGAVALYIRAYNDGSGYSSADLSTITGNGCPATAYLATIYIDVNGSELPNKLGRDVFGFLLAENGALYPYGSKNVSLLLDKNITNVWNNSNANDTSICGDSKKGLGLGCTARLIEKSYKVDY